MEFIHTLAVGIGYGVLIIIALAVLVMAIFVGWFLVQEWRIKLDSLAQEVDGIRKKKQLGFFSLESLEKQLKDLHASKPVSDSARARRDHVIEVNAYQKEIAQRKRFAA